MFTKHKSLWFDLALVCTLYSKRLVLLRVLYFCTSNFGAVAGDLLVFVDIEFFFYLNWFYFSTSWFIFLFLQVCLFIYLFIFSFWFDLKKKREKCFWCLLQNSQNSDSAKCDRALSGPASASAHDNFKSACGHKADQRSSASTRRSSALTIDHIL